jgi:hypothetical protein
VTRGPSAAPDRPCGHPTCSPLPAIWAKRSGPSAAGMGNPFQPVTFGCRKGPSRCCVADRKVTIVARLVFETGPDPGLYCSAHVSSWEVEHGGRKYLTNIAENVAERVFWKMRLPAGHSRNRATGTRCRIITGTDRGSEMSTALHPFPSQIPTIGPNTAETTAPIIAIITA